MNNRQAVFIIIFLYTFLPYSGVMWGNYFYEFSFDYFYLRLAYSVYTALIFLSVLLALRKVKKEHYEWSMNNKLIDEKHLYKKFKLIRNVTVFFTIIFFLVYGIRILGGEDRGVVRASVGLFGTVSTFVVLYAVPAILSLSSVYYFYFSSRSIHLRLLFAQIVVLSVFVGLMSGGKASVVCMLFVVVIQAFCVFTIKQDLLLLLFGILSIVVIGTFQMDMTFEESIYYNIYRALDLSAYGSICTWDYLPNGASNPLLCLYGGLGEHLTSIITSTNTHSIDFLKYSFPRAITYNYYANDVGAVEGVVNLTISSFGDTVYWLGRKYCYLLFIPTCAFVYKMIVVVFKTRNVLSIKKNSMYTVYFTSVVLSWFVSGGGDIARLFGLTTIVYMLLTYVLLSILCKL